MKFTHQEGVWEFYPEGPISEKTELFSHDIRKATGILLDMQKVTFINSIGVKNWISWMFSVPAECQITLRHCPFVIISQINMVQGFLPKTARVQSFYAPYTDNNGNEVIRLLTRGTDYDYATADTPALLTFTEEQKDPKTGKILEPDFIPDKVTPFLKNI